MRLLVLGGSSFVGRAVAAEAMRRDHAVTTFNRGKSGTDVPGVEAIRGDRARDEDIGQLADRTFDAAIDVSGLVPAHVRRSTRALAGTVPFYAYVSSVSAYRYGDSEPADEDAPLHEGRATEDGDPTDYSAYGRRKSGCESAVLQTYPSDGVLIVRPGSIIGPHDNLGHLPWWLCRISRGGSVLAPGDPGRVIQLIDARDLAAFVVGRLEDRAGGTFNTVPDAPTSTMGNLLDDCVATTGARASLVWVGEDFLAAHSAQPWDEVPLWLPDTAAFRAVWAVPGSAAAKAGLNCRPLHQSVRNTWRWLQAGGTVRTVPGLPTVGMDPEKETRLLAAWRGRPTRRNGDNSR